MEDPYAYRHPLLRLKRRKAGIVHKQFLLLKEDVPKAAELLKDLLSNANKAYGVSSKLVDAERLSKGEVPDRKNRRKTDAEPELADASSRPASPGPP